MTDSESCNKKWKQNNENLLPNTSESRNNPTKPQRIVTSIGLQTDDGSHEKPSQKDIFAAVQRRHHVREYTVRLSIIKLRNLLIGFSIIMSLSCFMIIVLIIFAMRSLLKRERYSELIDGEANRFTLLSDLTIYVGIIIYAVFQWYATASRASSKFVNKSRTNNTEGYQAKSVTPTTPVAFSLQRKSAVTWNG
eukprot:CAMPEP_0185282844 /NCGR_PEP_ID=MMETSP1359-20130426/67494_1 /TAXON_ID=552665 /ORGANISM="Bigelowiella longifila, Strain CCMP242" /LENGTH=192 /DNA_ID=CAMNT_0027878425 /DNA_START=385 /DNA_END=963 /DNA_ORIENTATION=-